MSNPTTNAGAVVAICATPQASDVTLSAAAALTYVTIGNVGQLGEHGYDTNIISYSVLDRILVLKAKGETNGGDFTIECAVNDTDAGQILANTAGSPSSSSNYIFKISYSDGGVHYLRGPVGGPKYSGGGNEDFRTATYTVGVNQFLRAPAT